MAARGSQLLTTGEQAEAQAAEPQPWLPQLVRRGAWIRAQVLGSESGTVVSDPPELPRAWPGPSGATQERWQPLLGKCPEARGREGVPSADRGLGLAGLEGQAPLEALRRQLRTERLGVGG